jgi:NADH dehydrogenase
LDSAARRLSFVFAGVQRRAGVQEPASVPLRRHSGLATVQPHWVLVDPAALILGQTPDGLARLAARPLRKRGVAILPEPALTRGEATAAVRFDGRRIETAPIVWTVGVAPDPLTAQLRLPHDERGRVPVDETLRVPDVPHVSARGDGAAGPNEATPGTTDPATCRHALRQVRRPGRNLRGTPHPYRHRARAQIATLGSRHSIVLAAGVRARGLARWLVALSSHRLQLPFTARRTRVPANCAEAALFPRRRRRAHGRRPRTERGLMRGSFDAVLSDLDGVPTSTTVLHARGIDARDGAVGLLVP